MNAIGILLSSASVAISWGSRSGVGVGTSTNIHQRIKRRVGVAEEDDGDGGDDERTCITTISADTVKHSNVTRSKKRTMSGHAPSSEAVQTIERHLAKFFETTSIARHFDAGTEATFIRVLRGGISALDVNVVLPTDEEMIEICRHWLQRQVQQQQQLGHGLADDQQEEGFSYVAIGDGSLSTMTPDARSQQQEQERNQQQQGAGNPFVCSWCSSLLPLIRFQRVDAIQEVVGGTTDGAVANDAGQEANRATPEEGGGSMGTGGPSVETGQTETNIKTIFKSYSS